jgi:signal transduction histidine kinase/phage shock protein PspC (stress-responsive transcriptional regulator)
VTTGTGTAPLPAPPALRRDPSRRILGGVCAGVARYFGIAPVGVRAGFVVATAAGGFGAVLYVLAWAFVPAAPGVAPGPVAARLQGRRAAVEVGAGVALLLVALLLGLRAAGLGFSDAVVWPVALVTGGVALLWRGSLLDRPDAPAPAREPRRAVISRTGLGIALVVAAGVVFLQATGALSTARDVVLAVLVVAVGLAVIFAPLVARQARSLAAERAERIRSDERAELAAHLHDSVLQTLAMVQRRAGEPREVAALARAQERELRAWLSNRPPPGDAVGTLRGALEAAADEIEQAQGVPVEVVAVGDAPLDEGTDALVAATREAVLNAAKFGGGSPVDVYAEAGDERVEVFIRDRGPGFDPAAVPPDRRGVRESIVGRMRRHGGRAAIRSDAMGTEVELVLERGDP